MYVSWLGPYIRPHQVSSCEGKSSFSQQTPPNSGAAGSMTVLLHALGATVLTSSHVLGRRAAR